MLLAETITTEAHEQEQKRNASFSTTTDTNEMVSQKAGASDAIDWHAIVQHLHGKTGTTTKPTLTGASKKSRSSNKSKNHNQSAQPSRLYIRVRVTDPNEEHRIMVENYLNMAAEFGTSSQAAGHSFESICEKFLPVALKRVLNHRFRFNRQDAEDIAQEAILSVWTWLNSYITEEFSEQEQGEQEHGRPYLENFSRMINLTIRNAIANWLQHQYRARNQFPNNGQPIKYIRLERIYSQSDAPEQLWLFGREVKLSHSTRSRSSNIPSPGNHETLTMYDPLDVPEVHVEQRELMKELAAAIAEMKRSNPHYATVLLEHVKGWSYQQIADQNNWTLDQVKKYLSRARKWLVNYFATASNTTNEKEGLAQAQRVKRTTTKLSAEEWQVAAD